MPPELQTENQLPLEAETSTPLLAAPPERMLLPRVAMGATLLAVSLFGGMALVSAALPHFLDSNAPAQVAAVQVPLDTSHFASLTLEAKSAYVFDASHDVSLYTREPDAQLPLASITKVMLALAVSDVLTMDETVVISREAVARGGGGLTYGETWRVRELLDFMLITSSNVAAEALREAAEPRLLERYPAASEGQATLAHMNMLARELGMRSTFFLNPTGLDESTTQAGAYGSARDIGTLFAYILRAKRDLFAGTARPEAVLGPVNMPKREVSNTNTALADIPHLFMGKTGFTDLAGGNLAVAFDASEGRPIVIVVLGSSPEGRFTDVRTLTEAALKTLGLSTAPAVNSVR